MHSNGVSGGGRVNIKPEDVISKLKDDGDFDRLRIKIIRKLKENEDLRSNIISMVKQSAALNCPGAENMKPRQISDTIHQEIGDKLKSQISDGVWSIIRSVDGMKNEIIETVQEVYEKLSNPQGKGNGESSSPKHLRSAKNKHQNNGDAAKVNEIGSAKLDGDLNELSDLANGPRRSKKSKVVQPNNIRMPTTNFEKSIERNQQHNSQLKALPEPDNFDDDAPPGFSSVVKHKTPGQVSDEDPDLPPGFG